MNLTREFESFHFHASCAVSAFGRMVLVAIGISLGKAQILVTYLHSQLADPKEPLEAK